MENPADPMQELARAANEAHMLRTEVEALKTVVMQLVLALPAEALARVRQGSAMQQKQFQDLLLASGCTDEEMAWMDWTPIPVRMPSA